MERRGGAGRVRLYIYIYVYIYRVYIGCTMGLNYFDSVLII